MDYSYLPLIEMEQFCPDKRKKLKTPLYNKLVSSYKTKSKKGRKHSNIPSNIGSKNIMANKFLPFIVEKSDPINIYQTLLSRSKGINSYLITSVFNIVINVGILEVRAWVNKLNDMPVKELYERVVENYSASFIVDSVALTYLLSIENYLSFEEKQLWSKELDQFNTNDILRFLFVMAISRKEKNFTSLNIKDLINLPYIEAILDNVPQNVNFCDDGERIVFDSSYELKGFILYRAIIYNHENSNGAKSVFRAMFTQPKSASIPKPQESAS